MWTDLQMKLPRQLPLILGCTLTLLHAMWVLLIDHVSRRNLEFERAWEVQYYLDLPISWLATPLDWI